MIVEGTTAAISAVAGYHLVSSGKLDIVFSSLLNDFDATDQLSLFVILFSVVFFFVSLITSTAMASSSSSATTAKSSSGRDKKKYPLEELSKAGSDRERFLVLFPFLRDEALELMSSNNEMPKEAIDWCREMMDYNVPGGKLNRGMTVVAVHRTLIKAQKQRDLTLTEEARATILGWAIEFLQAFFLVADDVMDDSKTRRGQPCWYKLPRVKLIAINDSFLLESFVIGMIRHHFESEPYYADLLHLFLETTQKTEFGQLLDLTSQAMDATSIDLDRFTLDRYRLIVKYKTAFYSFYLPVAIGMITSGIRENEAFHLARNICCIMGEYFQIQDDYLDCFGDPQTIGKIGTDIQENKCSWLVVQALLKVNPAQRKILEDNYGQWDDAKVAKVKELYKELDLPSLFAEYEEDSYKRIQKELDHVNLMPRDVFELFLKKIYKRSK